jgi:hypothetical protein
MTQQIRTRTRDASLIDEVRESPVDEALHRKRRRLALVLLAAVAIALVAVFLTRRRPPAAAMRAPVWSAEAEVVSS